MKTTASKTLGAAVLAAVLLTPGTFAQTLIDEEALCRYYGSADPPPGSPRAWRELDYDDSSWLQGLTGLGYGDDDDNTVLPEMHGNYISLLVRLHFEVDDAALIPGLVLRVWYDDGFVAYLNGTEVARSANMEKYGPDVPLDVPATLPHEAMVWGWEEYPVDSSFLRTGPNVLAAQVHNNTLESADLSFIPVLAVDTRDLGVPFRRGDANDDGTVNLADAVFTLNWLFGGATAPGCLAATNINGDEATNIADPIALLGFLFGGGSPPVAPFPDCGASARDSDLQLGCETPPASCP